MVGCQNENENFKLETKVKDEEILNLGNFSHKNVFEFEVVEIDEKYVFLQEDFRGFKYISLETNITSFRTFQKIKIISGYLHSIKFLHSVGSICNQTHEPFVYVDERYNVKNNVMFDIFLKSNDQNKQSLEIIAYQKINWSLYDIKSCSFTFIEEAKTENILIAMINVQKFCLFLLKQIECKDLLIQKERFLRLLNNPKFKNKSYLDDLINSDLLDYVAISFVDFRKFKSNIGFLEYYVYIIEMNKITFRSTYINQILEITILNDLCYRQSREGKIQHHHSLKIRQNGRLIDPDNLDEDRFNYFQKELNKLSEQLKNHKTERIKFTLQNEVFIFIEYCNPKKYCIMYLKHPFKDVKSVVFGLYKDEIVNYPPHYFFPEKIHRYSKQVRVFMKYLIKEKKRILKDLKAQKKEKLYKNKEDGNMPYFFNIKTSKFYVPGVSKEEKNKSNCADDVNFFKKLSYRKLIFSIKNYDSIRYTRENDSDEDLQDESCSLRCKVHFY